MVLVPCSLRSELRLDVPMRVCQDEIAPARPSWIVGRTGKAFRSGGANADGAPAMKLRRPRPS